MYSLPGLLQTDAHRCHSSTASLRAQELDGELHKMLISHISAEFMERQELAVEWLFHEFAAERIDLQKKATPEGEAGRNGRYNKILLVRTLSLPPFENSATEW